MLKAGIIVCALCAGAAGTTVWVKAERVAGSPERLHQGPSWVELHNAAHLDNLPVQQSRGSF